MFIISENNPYLLVYPNVKFVKGYNRTCVMDLQRNEIYLLPNEVRDIVFNAKDNAFEYRKTLNKSDKDVFDYYIDILVAKEYIFFVKNELKNSFPEISSDYTVPYNITNSIICVNERTINAMDNRFYKELGELGVQAIMCYGEEEWIRMFLKGLAFTRIKDIQLVILDKALLGRDYNWLVEYNISSVYVSSMQNMLTIKKTLKSNYINMSVLSQIDTVNCHLFCGLIRKDELTSNLTFYNESLSANSCLNKKMAIDFEGNIKNCIGTKKAFGNIFENTIFDVVNKEEFKGLWKITKDSVNVCKDCEFRYACTDCRAYVENVEDILSKPLKCGYSPYTNIWSEWSQNELKQKSIESYGMSEML